MPTLHVELPDDVASALGQQARSLLMSRSVYVRSLLAQVAAQSLRTQLGSEPSTADTTPAGEVTRGQD